MKNSIFSTKIFNVFCTKLTLKIKKKKFYYFSRSTIFETLESFISNRLEKNLNISSRSRLVSILNIFYFYRNALTDDEKMLELINDFSVKAQISTLLKKNFQKMRKDKDAKLQSTIKEVIGELSSNSQPGTSQRPT